MADDNLARVISTIYILADKNLTLETAFKFATNAYLHRLKRITKNGEINDQISKIIGLLNSPTPHPRKFYQELLHTLFTEEEFKTKGGHRVQKHRLKWQTKINKSRKTKLKKNNDSGLELKMADLTVENNN